jgi:DUF4097 and DUF4098 domain-containing protein YvlB
MTYVWPLPFTERPELEFDADVLPVVLVPAAGDEQPRLELFGTDAGDIQVEVAKHDDVVRAQVRWRDAIRWFHHWDARVVLHVPAGITATVGTDAGQIEARDLGPGSLTFRTRAGRIRLRDLRGRVRATSEAGSIEAAHVTASDLELQTTAGRIVVEHASGNMRLHTRAGRIDGQLLMGRLDVEANLGSVRLAIAGLAPGQHRVQSSAGSIEIELARGLSVQVSARTNLGSVRNEYPTQPDAAAELAISTNLGSVTVREGGFDATSADQTKLLRPTAVR